MTLPHPSRSHHHLQPTTVSHAPHFPSVQKDFCFVHCRVCDLSRGPGEAQKALYGHAGNRRQFALRRLLLWFSTTSRRQNLLLRSTFSRGGRWNDRKASLTRSPSARPHPQRAPPRCFPSRHALQQMSRRDVVSQLLEKDCQTKPSIEDLLIGRSSATRLSSRQNNTAPWPAAPPRPPARR